MPGEKALGGCEGRRGFRSKAEARLALRRQRGLRRAGMSAYRCPKCGSFHIGNRPTNREPEVYVCQHGSKIQGFRQPEVNCPCCAWPTTCLWVREESMWK